jgi:hypothetical protein
MLNIVLPTSKATCSWLRQALLHYESSVRDSRTLYGGLQTYLVFLTRRLRCDVMTAGWSKAQENSVQHGRYVWFIRPYSRVAFIC